LFAYGDAFDRWVAASRVQLSAIKNFQLYYLSDDLIAPLVAQLTRSVEWQFTNSDKTLYITAGDESIVGELVEIDLD